MNKDREGLEGCDFRSVCLFSGLLVPFQLVFDMLVLQKHSAEMTTAAGEAFYTLVCLHQVGRGSSAGPLRSSGSLTWGCSSVEVRSCFFTSSLALTYLLIGQAACQVMSISFPFCTALDHPVP